MTRLKEICENHSNLDELSSVLKHYSVNAQFVAESLIQSFEKNKSEDNEDNESEGKVNLELIEDLKQYIAKM